MKEKIVRSAWLESKGRRLDCGPYMSGAIEARELLKGLPVRRAELRSVTRGHAGGIYKGTLFARNYVSDPTYGVPFLSSSSMLHAEFRNVDLLRKSDAVSSRLACLQLEEGTTLISRSGTIGRMAYTRREMAGMWSSEHVLKVVPDPKQVRPGYLYAFLSSRFGVPLVTGSTYGAIVQHVEPDHLADLPVPLAPPAVQEEVHRLVTEAGELRTWASAELRAIIREIEESSGLPPLDARSSGPQPDTSLVNASALRSRMDGLFHSEYHRSIVKRLLRKATIFVGQLVDRIFKPPMFKKIPAVDRRFGLPLFDTASIMRADPDTSYYLSSRTRFIDELILNEKTVMVPADGQLNGIIGHPVLPIGDVVGGTVNNHAIRLFCTKKETAGFLMAALSSEYARRQLKARAYGSSIPSLDEAGVSGVVLPLLRDKQMEELGRRAFAVRTARHDAISKEREARSFLERWIEDRVAG